VVEVDLTERSPAEAAAQISARWLSGE